jgi:hypothetical protein
MQGLKGKLEGKDLLELGHFATGENRKILPDRNWPPGENVVVEPYELEISCCSESTAGKKCFLQDDNT